MFKISYLHDVLRFNCVKKKVRKSLFYKNKPHLVKAKTKCIITFQLPVKKTSTSVILIQNTLHALQLSRLRNDKYKYRKLEDLIKVQVNTCYLAHENTYKNSKSLGVYVNAMSAMFDLVNLYNVELCKYVM